MNFLKNICSCFGRTTNVYADVEICHFELVGNDSLRPWKLNVKFDIFFNLNCSIIKNSDYLYISEQLVDFEKSNNEVFRIKESSK